MNRNIFYFSLLSLAVAGCSSINNKQADGGFDYAKQPEGKKLTIPNGLKAPNKKSDFFISDDINRQGPVAEKVDVRAPSLVLPIAASSRVEPNSSDAKIWFDQVLDSTDLQSFIYQALQEQLASDGVGMDVVDKENNIYESQWYNQEKQSGYWLFEEVESTESIRFRYQLVAKPHGRSVALIVTVVDYMKSDKSGATKTMDVIDKKRAEMAMLNEVVSQVDFKYRKEQRENRLMRANQQLVSIGTNNQSQPAYVVEMDLDSLWSNMPIFFEDFGFKVSDLNESKKIYYVDFVKPDVSLWDKLWGDEVPIIELADQRYQFVLSPVDEKDESTTITILDANGEPLPAETLKRIFPVIEPGLSFRDSF